jgi:hypothetical protein
MLLFRQVIGGSKRTEADVMEGLPHRLRQQLSAVSEAHNAIPVKEKKTLDKP